MRLTNEYLRLQVKAPSEINVLMSAIKEENVEESNSMKIHKFNQPKPIPSYLIAIAAGNIVSERIGPRSKVWAEPEYLQKSAWEFQETENMLKTAEDLCGPYVWGKLNVLICMSNK